MAKLTSPSVVCVVPDKFGGMLNIVEGLFRFRRPDGVTYGVILTNNPLGQDTRFNGRFNADYQAAFEFKTPIENLYMCGSATHPGGGIMAAPGRIASTVILKEWKSGPSIKKNSRAQAGN